jgi:spermidine synthase
MNEVPEFFHVIYELFDCPIALLRSVDLGRSALASIIASAGLTRVDGFAHTYAGGGYSCCSFLSESHITIHTWPELAYCAADVFLCSGDHKHVDRPMIAEFQPQSWKKQVVVRGSRDDSTSDWLNTDEKPVALEAFKAGNVLVRRQSPFQLIEIAEHSTYGKILCLDHDIQLATSDEALYHGALVHPVMRAHPSPRTAAILGGGDGGALREVVKYKSLATIVLFDIDRDVVTLCGQYLPEVHQGAFTDPRVRLEFGDIADWTSNEKYDIIIVDLTAPRGCSHGAYNRVLVSIKNNLSDNGFLSIHSGRWSDGKSIDVSQQIEDNFRHVLARNHWIASFESFWSFLVLWDHRECISDVLQRIGTRHSEVACSFEATAYVHEAYTRAAL